MMNPETHESRGFTKSSIEDFVSAVGFAMFVTLVALVAFVL